MPREECAACGRAKDRPPIFAAHQPSANAIRLQASPTPWQRGWRSHPSRPATGSRRVRDAAPSPLRDMALYTERASTFENIRPMPRWHAPIDVRRVGLDSRKLCDPRVVRRKLAYRIGCGSITGKGEGLATAAPKIELAARTACAWLLHPCGAAEGIEGRGVCPDVSERMLAHVPEFQAGERLGGVTGQHLARGCPH